MRVIAGIAGGCHLISPKGLETRPTADRMKENLFNLLSPLLPESRFLDLFSGSGAIGIEALSRGAREAVFVEKFPPACAVIAQNLQKTRLAEQASLLRMSVDKALAQLSQDGLPFDIIYMDPPFDSTWVEKTLSFLSLTRLLNPNGVIVAEMSANDVPPVNDAFNIDRTKLYGSIQFVFYVS